MGSGAAEASKDVTKLHSVITDDLCVDKELMFCLLSTTKRELGEVKRSPWPLLVPRLMHAQVLGLAGRLWCSVVVVPGLFQATAR